MTAAGLADELSAETADKTLRGEGLVVPKTPDHMKKWRKNYEPGVRQIHPGVADDQDYKKNGDVPYGRSEPVGVKVHDVLNVAPKSYLLEKANQKKEQIYLSHKREPLGTQYKRGHEIPQHLVEKGFGRETPQDVSGDQGKQLLHPIERLVPPEEKALYRKSHANFDPGEQKHRGYKWVDQSGTIDPATYTFGGIVCERDVNGMGKAMNPALDERIPKDPVVVDKLLEDFREAPLPPPPPSTPHAHPHAHRRARPHACRCTASSSASRRTSASATAASTSRRMSSDCPRRRGPSGARQAG
jgi:hypothetical protein